MEITDEIGDTSFSVCGWRGSVKAEGMFYSFTSVFFFSQNMHDTCNKLAKTCPALKLEIKARG